MEGHMKTSFVSRAPFAGVLMLCIFALAALAGCGGGGGASAVTVVSDASAKAPTIRGTPATQVTAGQPYSFTPTASSPTGSALSFSVQSLPAWAHFSSTTGTLSGTPAEADVGSFANIVISVSDGKKSASLPPFSIQVSAAAAPAISGTPGTAVGVGQAYSFTPTASGPSGTTLSFSVQHLPSWASFSTTTGTLSGTPQSAGTFAGIVISVSDGQASASLPAFTIQVTTAAQPPTISGTPASAVTAGQVYSFTPTASGPSGTKLTFSVQNLPSWASFSTSTGTLSGSPSASSVGTFSNIVISVSDGQMSASLPAFAIQVKAQPPTISGAPATSVTAGQAYSFTPTASGPAGMTLTYSVSSLPSWASFSTSTGTLSGTPSASNVGTFSNIVISVSDGQASASLAAFSIQVKAQPPTISGSPPASVTAGQAYSFTPTASGPAGMTLTYSVSNLPSWAAFSTSSGTLSGTPSASNVGTFSNIVISVSDGQASASLPAFSIQVKAQAAPTISGTPPASVTAGQAYSFTPTASGPTGLTLSFSVQNLPSWATFSIATGAVTGTPSASNVGTFSNIVISVSDGQASASLPAFSIQVKAVVPPTISGTPPGTVTAGQLYTFTPTASGPTGLTLSFSVQNLPSWATFSVANGTVSGTPSASNVGTFSNIVISVSDGQASASLAAFSIQVKAQSTTGSATLSWVAPTTNTDGTPLTDLAGYIINYGTSSGTLNQQITVSSATATGYTVTGLASGTWYFTVTAYTSVNTQSAPSDMVSEPIS